MNTIYIDMDGVLANFNSYFVKITGKPYEEYEQPKDAWAALGEYKEDIYSKLEPMPDAADLVAEIVRLASIYSLNVEILTGVPKIGRVLKAKEDKVSWVARYFPILSNKVNIGPWAEDKWKHCIPRDILVDDSMRNIKDWYKAGGIGIHHTDSINTIRTLTRFLHKNKNYNIKY